MSKAKKIVKLPHGKTLDEIMRDLNDYNRINKTCLSYGQYVSLLYMQSKKKA